VRNLSLANWIPIHLWRSFSRDTFADLDLAFSVPSFVFLHGAGVNYRSAWTHRGKSPGGKGERALITIAIGLHANCATGRKTVPGTESCSSFSLPSCCRSVPCFASLPLSPSLRSANFHPLRTGCPRREQTHSIEMIPSCLRVHAPLCDRRCRSFVTTRLSRMQRNKSAKRPREPPMLRQATVFLWHSSRSPRIKASWIFLASRGWHKFIPKRESNGQVLF